MCRGGCLSAVLRPLDAVARWGGEEFVVLLPSSGEAEAVRLAERGSREAVAAISLDNQGCRVPVTVSAGVASSEHDPRNPDLERLLHAADCAM